MYVGIPWEGGRGTGSYIQWINVGPKICRSMDPVTSHRNSYGSAKKETAWFIMGIYLIWMSSQSQSNQVRKLPHYKNPPIGVVSMAPLSVCVPMVVSISSLSFPLGPAPKPPVMWNIVDVPRFNWFIPCDRLGFPQKKNGKSNKPRTRHTLEILRVFDKTSFLIWSLHPSCLQRNFHFPIFARGFSSLSAATISNSSWSQFWAEFPIRQTSSILVDYIPIFCGQRSPVFADQIIIFAGRFFWCLWLNAATGQN